MQLYGLRVIQHHSANRVLIVMSTEGIEAARSKIVQTDGLEIRGGPGRFTQYVEQIEGALARLTSTYGIEVLDPDPWARKKVELGERCR